MPDFTTDTLDLSHYSDNDGFAAMADLLHLRDDKRLRELFTSVFELANKHRDDDEQIEFLGVGATVYTDTLITSIRLRGFLNDGYNPVTLPDDVLRQIYKQWHQLDVKLFNENSLLRYCTEIAPENTYLIYRGNVSYSRDH